MKILLDLDQFDYKIFNTKEDYDNDTYSKHSYYAAVNDKNSRIDWGRRPRYRYTSEPEKFPCILIRGHMIYNPNGPDEIIATYLYDFEIVENDDE